MDDRDAAISLLRKGLVTMAEAGRLVGVTRQIVQYWVKLEQLDLDKAREGHLRKLWKKTISNKRR